MLNSIPESTVGAQRRAVRRAVERQRDIRRMSKQRSRPVEAKPESAFPLKGGCRGSGGGVEREIRPMADRGVRKKAAS